MDLIETERRKQLTMILYVIVNIVLNMFTALYNARRKCHQRRILMERPVNRVFLRVENLN